MGQTLGTISHEEIKDELYQALSKMSKDKLVGILTTYFKDDVLRKGFAQRLIRDKVLNYSDLNLEPVDDYEEPVIDSAEVIDHLFDLQA